MMTIETSPEMEPVIHYDARLGEDETWGDYPQDEAGRCTRDFVTWLHRGDLKQVTCYGGNKYIFVNDVALIEQKGYGYARLRGWANINGNIQYVWGNYSGRGWSAGATITSLQPCKPQVEPKPAKKKDGNGMKQAWYSSLTAEERDQAIATLRREVPGIEVHPCGHTNEQDAHVSPYLIIRYSGRFSLPSKFFNSSSNFPASLYGGEGNSIGLVEGVDVPEWV